LEPVLLSGRALVCHRGLLAIAACARRLVCCEWTDTDARHSITSESFGPAHRSLVLPIVRTGRDGGRKFSAIGRVRSGPRTWRLPSQRQGKSGPLQGVAFTGRGLPIYVCGAEGLARVSM